MCTKNKTFRPSNVSTYVKGTKVPDETPDLCSKIWDSFDASKASEKSLFYLKMKHERQSLVLPEYVPCLGRDQVVRTSTGEKKGERLMAFTRPPPSQTRRAALPSLPNVHQFKDPWSLRENMEQILVTDKSNWNLDCEQASRQAKNSII